MLNIPVSYVFLRLGFPPLTVFYVSLAISVVCLFMRLWIVRRLMPFPVKEYVVRVFGTSLAVCTLATIAPVAVHIAVDGNIHTVLSVCALMRRVDILCRIRQARAQVCGRNCQEENIT